MNRNVNGPTILAAGPSDEGKRLDSYVAARLDLSRARVQRLIEDGDVTVNGGRAFKSDVVRAGEKITITIPAAAPSRALPEQIPLKIVYEDGQIIVVSKPAGMVVHPAPGHATGTLVNALLAHSGNLSVIGGEERPGIVHRLDKETSGLMMAAKTDEAHRGLSAALKERHIKKTYLVLVRGNVTGEKGQIKESVGRHARNRKKMTVDGIAAREAVTNWRTVKRYEGFTLLEANPETGRTHQIRVHLAHAGYPVAGDKTYRPDPAAEKKLGLKRQFLHAAGLDFRHPVTGQAMSFKDELPDDLKGALAILDRQAPTKKRSG